MSISIAEYLINQAVRTTSGLYQQSKDGSNQAILKSQREKAAHRVEETRRPTIPSSAYRVTISPAAMQKMASSSLVG